MAGYRLFGLLFLLSALALGPRMTQAASRYDRYYAHPVVIDSHGVIAPWYTGLNGQFDYRVRVAAETLKRYPWTDASRAVAAVPEYILSGAWKISSTGEITIPPINDWANGDMGQRAAYILSALVDYYRYSGDPAAIAHITLAANTLLDFCQTDSNHPWPGFLISVPNRGKPYQCCDPKGFIQLDIVAEVGVALLRAYQLVGEERWFEAAKRWGDLLAEKRDRNPGMPPWNRYANPEDVEWEDPMTGGVAFLLTFFEELISLDYKGKDGAILEARDVGRAYLRDVLLPKWTVDDVWGRNYWDWPDPVQAENVTEFTVRYLMEHPDAFPNWRSDARNILSLFIQRTSVAETSGGDVFHGAWAYPESSGCCKRSLWYGPQELATVYAQYGVLANSEWARELARRQQILATYDFHETGVVEDNIEGGFVVAADWFKIAHPMALKHVLGTMAWLPDIEGAARENHIMRTSSVVTTVTYGKGRVAYTTIDGKSPGIDVLRLAFHPKRVTADGRRLPIQTEPDTRGYTVEALPCGDSIVTIRHDGLRKIVVSGADPQSEVDDAVLEFQGDWGEARSEGALKGKVHVAELSGSTAVIRFQGNQVRLLGSVGPEGGLAEVRLDAVRQRAGLDCWNPTERRAQVLYYKNGLAEGEHVLEVIALGKGNPISTGTRVWIDGAQWSEATGQGSFGEGGGPTETQRWVFGYPGREDLIDRAGNRWRPATEFVTRLGHLADSVSKSWWSERRRLLISGTEDPELYRHGVHAPEFWANVTVGPGTYYARLKFAETRMVEVEKRLLDVLICGEEKARALDLAATAGGMNRALDLSWGGIRPQNGVIEVRLKGTSGGEAILQALEVGPDPERGAPPPGE